MFASTHMLILYKKEQKMYCGDQSGTFSAWSPVFGVKVFIQTHVW